MRVVLFGSGSEYSRIILGAIADRHNVIAVVTPSARGPLLRRLLRAFRIWRAGGAFRNEARRRGIERIAIRSAANSKLIKRLRALEADLIVVASFPYVIPRSLCDLARLGALNVHPSLLPRHRGADPLFWTFFYDEPAAGSTVHWVGDALDAGDIAEQQSVVVRRGVRYHELAAEMAVVGGALCVKAIDDLVAGRAKRTPQNEAMATSDPIPSVGGWSIDFDSWTAERLWHFLRGVGGSHPWAVGQALPAGEAVDFTIAPPARAPGTVERINHAVRIYTRDGWVTARALR